MKRTRCIRRAAFTLAAALLAGAAGCDDSTAPEVDELMIEVAADEVTLDVGETYEIVAAVVNKDNQVHAVALNWESANEQVATVSQAGVVTAVGPGQAMIRIRAKAQIKNHVMQQEQIQLQVQVRENAATIEIVPPGPVEVEVGDTLTFIALVKDAQGEILDREVTWSIDDELVATLSETGFLTAVGPGVAVVTAKACDVLTATATVTVQEPVASVEVTAPDGTLVLAGGSIQLLAIPRNADGQALGRPVTWDSSDETVATVAADGAVSAHQAGIAQITATSGGESASVEVEVLSAPASMEIIREALEENEPILVGATEQLQAIVYDAQSQVIDRAPVKWESSDLTLATVSEDGLVTGVARGSVTITARAGPVSASISLRVAGSGGGEEGVGNNLSVPVVFAEGVGLGGAAITPDDPGLRPLAEEEAGPLAAGAEPFWWEGNEPDCGPDPENPTFFCQGSSNTWRAEWLDGSVGPQRSALVAWGDNLTHHQFDTHAPVRIEVVLWDQDVTLQGFEMPFSSGEMMDEIFGSNGQIIDTLPTIFSKAARLTISKLDDASYNPETGEGEVLEDVFEGSIEEGWGSEGPGSFAAEVNGGGKVIYGFILRVQDVVLVTPEVHKYGWWRLKFSMDPGHNVSLDALPPEGDEPLLFQPRLGSGGQFTWLDINIKKASGGGGGHGN